MTVTNPNALTPDKSDFIKSAFTFKLGDNYTTTMQILVNTVLNSEQDSADQQKLNSVLSNVGGGDAMLPAYYSKRKCRDTSLGGNDVINPLYQYCENDDIVHPFTSTNNSGDKGMGRVVSEELDDHQQVMWLSLGHPQFNNLTDFYKDAFSGSLSRIVNQGPGADGTSFSDIGELFGSGLTTLVILPAIPLLFLKRLVSGIDNVSITKYYDFSSQMLLYYRTVNSIIAHLAVGMGLTRDAAVLQGVKDRQTTGSTTNSLGTVQEQYAAAAAGSSDTQGMPDVFQKHGFDIYRIMMQKYLYEEAAETSNLGSTDQFLREQFGSTVEMAVSKVIEDINTDSTTLADRTTKVWTAFKSTLYDAQMFIGFRVTSSTDSSESVSNSTGPSEIAQTLNAKLQSASAGNFTSGGWLSSTFGSLVDFMTGVRKGIGDGMSLSDISAAATGAGYVDIPEVWQGSTFSRSYTFNMTLRSPYADPASIMINEYIPLACILAAVLPRQIGRNSYASPFICRAYCKGMFAVPLGMIDSVSIKRGGDMHGWTNQRFPRVINISFTIKDLSPVMYTALANNSITSELSQIFGANSSFQEYLMTLAGTGLAERVLWTVGLRRKWETFLQINAYNRFSPFALGMNIGNTAAGRVIAAMNPSTRIARN